MFSIREYAIQTAATRCRAPPTIRPAAPTLRVGARKSTSTTAKAPQVGQLIAFGTGGSRRTYTVIEATDNGSTADLLLDRPLEVAVANDAAAFPGPYGAFNWAFHKDALALVTRPLATPPANRGVDSANAQYNDVSMRVSMQYDIQSQGTVVALDILAGVAVLDIQVAPVGSTAACNTGAHADKDMTFRPWLRRNSIE